MKSFTLLLLVSSLTTSVAFASQIIVVTFGGLPATKGNGTSLTQSNTYDGEVPATIAGVLSQDLVCDDFDDGTDVSNGSQVDFSVETLSSLTGAMFTSGFVTGLAGEGSGMTEVEAYDTAAVLLTELEALGAENSGDAQAVADYSYAIWELMEPSVGDGNNSAIKDGPLDANAAGYLQSAFTAVVNNATATQTEESHLVIYTPAVPAFSGSQEFLGLSTPTANPEPATWLPMSVLGLLLCVPQVRSRLTAALSRK